MALGSKSNDVWRIKPQGGDGDAKKTANYDTQKDWRTAFFWGKYYSHAAEKHTYDPAALFKNSMPESLNEKRLLDQAAKESI